MTPAQTYASVSAAAAHHQSVLSTSATVLPQQIPAAAPLQPSFAPLSQPIASVPSPSASPPAASVQTVPSATVFPTAASVQPPPASARPIPVDSIFVALPPLSSTTNLHPMVTRSKVLGLMTQTSSSFVDVEPSTYQQALPLHIGMLLCLMSTKL